MLEIVVFLGLAVCQAAASGVQVAPVATGVVTARSSQYFAQNHNGLAAPLVAPVVEPLARLEAAVAPVAPVVQYLAPSAASVSQVTRYGQYIAPAFAQYVAAPLVTLRPLVASTQPIAAAVPQQPAANNNPAFQAPNPDSETVEIEAARVRALPQAGRQQAAPQLPQSLPLDFAQARNLAAYQNFGQNQQRQPIGQAAARNQAQEQRRSGAPGLLSSQQYIQGPYFA